MLDRRREHRGRTYLGGQVAFNNRWCTVDCLVRNMSQGGARIEFPEPVLLPSDLELLIPLKGHSRRVRVMWKQAKALGVSFLDRDSGTVVPIEVARQIRKLKAERDALARRVRDLSESSI
ncbi:PilZ domain-containing protein [Pleomorphomonas diazotrophica]|nr:PilZ domain-containing protein [Pleomorphomonas diazotrophica]SFN13484.1 PilZ domain-containing protein [Pleomorphomonas diazotrophica]